MYAVRLWSVRHARALERFYAAFEQALIALDPVFRRLGEARLGRPVAAIERGVKGLLFDCQMCGRCVLSSTGMSCPMNCPKNLRNGPCGGVRADGRCEVKPEMACVWVQAWAGAERMAKAASILEVQRPVEHSLKGSSAWLRVAREQGGGDGAATAPAGKAA